MIMNDTNEKKSFKERVRHGEDEKEQKTNKGNKKSFSFVKLSLSFVKAIILFAIVVGIFGLIDFATIGTVIEEAVLIISIMIVLFFAVIVAGAYSVYIYFAPRDLYWGGVPEEGTACIVVAGTEKRKGKFIKAQMSFRGRKFDKDWNVVPDETFYEGRKSFLEQIGLGGIFRIGLPGIRRRFKYYFSWSSMLPNGELDPHEIKDLDHISLKEDTYATLIPKAEAAKSMVPMDIKLLVTAQVINPRKALFEVDHWLQNVINLTKVPALAYIAKMDNPRELIGNKQLMVLFFTELETSGLIKHFRDNYGVEVSRVNVAAIDLDETEKNAAMEQWKAERSGEAYQTKIAMETDADVDRIDRINKKVQEFGDLGVAIEYLKTAEKSGNIVIPPAGMIGHIVKQAFGRNESSDEIVKLLKKANITGDDIKDFVKIIKAMKEKDEEE